MVRIGDVGVIDVAPLALRNDRIASRSLDNRIGSYVAAETARLVAAAGGAPGDVFGLAVAQEETTFAGARTSAFGLQPDVAVVVDVTHATDQPGVELGQTTKHELGSGPVIARGLSLHPAVTELLLVTAEQEGIPHTVESSGRATGTDADAVHATGTGVPTAVVSIPLRYMHSPVELVALSDVDAAVRLLAAFAQRWDRTSCSSADSGRRRRRCCCSTSMARWSRVRRGPTRRRCTRRCTRFTGSTRKRSARRSRRRGGPMARSRGCCCWRRVCLRRKSTNAPTMYARPAASSTRELCPPDLSDKVIAGIPALLSQLQERTDVTLSLVTGNYEPVGRLKLKRAGLGRFFAAGQGGFGSDAEDRAELPQIARQRAGSDGIPFARDHTIVIGDTPRDIYCARADGVRCLAVATGPYDVEQLQDADGVAADTAELGELLAAALGDCSDQRAARGVTADRRLSSAAARWRTRRTCPSASRASAPDPRPRAAAPPAGAGRTRQRPPRTLWPPGEASGSRAR